MTGDGEITHTPYVMGNYGAVRTSQHAHARTDGADGRRPSAHDRQHRA
jgi:hypothetical protein